jgi:hypothetical protein
MASGLILKAGHAIQMACSTVRGFAVLLLGILLYPEENLDSRHTKCLQDRKVSLGKYIVGEFIYVIHSNILS